MIDKMMKSVIDQDRASVVICNPEHVIVYMNPAAKMRYAKRDGGDLVGKSLMNCHNAESKEIIEKVIAWFQESESNNMIYTFHNEKENKDGYMVALRDADGRFIGYYEKHEYRNREAADMYDFERSLV